jgi:chromosome segregation ATPase
MKRMYVLIFIASLFTSAANAQNTIKSTNRTYNADDQVENINMDMNGVSYKMKTVKGEMTEFSVDGKSIPAANWSDYRTVINEIKEQVEKDRIQAKQDRVQAKQDRAQAKLDKAQADRDREQADKDREQAKRDQVQAGKDREQAEKDRMQADKDRVQAEKDREQAGRDRIQADKDRAQAEIDRKQAEKDRKMMAALMDDLIQDKIVSNKESIEDLIISKNGMVVNGIQQPENVFKKYKEKYPRLGHLTYNNHSTSISTSN